MHRIAARLDFRVPSGASTAIGPPVSRGKLAHSGFRGSGLFHLWRIPPHFRAQTLPPHQIYIFDAARAGVVVEPHLRTNPSDGAEPDGEALERGFCRSSQRQ
jgi:hypothetical protein